jgi:hypothetical protein
MGQISGRFHSSMNDDAKPELFQVPMAGSLEGLAYLSEPLLAHLSTSLFLRLPVYHHMV